MLVLFGHKATSHSQCKDSLLAVLGCQVPTEAGDSSILSSAAASLQLLPHLLGFPIALTASEEVLPLPDALVDPEQAPRVASLSYKGAMLDGLQASRSLYNAQPPGNAPGQQGMDPDAAPPGEGSLHARQLACEAVTLSIQVPEPCMLRIQSFTVKPASLPCCKPVTQAALVRASFSQNHNSSCMLCRATCERSRRAMAKERATTRVISRPSCPCLGSTSGSRCRRSSAVEEGRGWGSCFADIPRGSQGVPAGVPGGCGAGLAQHRAGASAAPCAQGVCAAGQCCAGSSGPTLKTTSSAACKRQQITTCRKLGIP